MITRRFRLALAVAAVIGLASCADSIVRLIEPEENNEQLTLEPDSFRYYLEDLRNVSDRRRFIWRNNHPRALFFHRSFLHHGDGLVIIRDAAGAVVDSTTLEWELNTDTEVGVPGDWTIDLILASGRGRVDFSLQGVDADTPIPSKD